MSSQAERIEELEGKVARLERQIDRLERIETFLMLQHGLACDPRGYGFDPRRMRADALSHATAIVSERS
jgi:hypothetical protein